MVEYDFCFTVNAFVCTVETILSFVPLMVFIALGFYSYKQTKGISAYARDAYTKRHVTKLAISTLLSITSFAFLLVYLLAEANVSIKTLITWAITCFLWIFNSVLMRKEFEKLGFTTNYLKVSWLTMFICQTILLILAAAHLNKDNFGKIAIPYSINEAALLVMIVLGFFYSDDYPTERKPTDLYSSIASEIGLEVDEEIYRTLVQPQRKSIVQEEKKEEDFFKPFGAENGHHPQREQRSRRGSNASDHPHPNMTVSTERKENSWRTSSPAAPINLREEVNNIENIAVVGHQDTIRFDKQTILYTIEYYIRGQKFVTKRSNSEFRYLYGEIKKDNIAIDLSKFPYRKPLLSKTEEVIEDRTEGFDRFLKMLVAERVASNYLKEFLQTPNNLPYYGKISKKDSAKLVPPNNSISSEVGDRKPLLPESQETIRLSSSEKSDSAVLNPANRMNSSNRFSESVRIRNYKADIIRSFKGAEDSIYYTIRIKECESGNEIIIVKRFREFKTLHDQLKKTGKKYKDSIPELPNKGKAGALANADDPRVVEHRKKMLPVYLQQILNNPDFYDNQAISQFLQSSAQH